jgi:bifunctional enzyme CysN/CysC
MTEDLPGPEARPFLKIVIVGHVDHGKSSLIGRLLYETDSLPEGKFEELKAVSAKRGMPLEWSFVLDAFQAERDQAVTIDTTQVWFKTAKRDYVIIDAPGHREFLKNMVSGASAADAAVLVIDAKEGVREQTRRHGYLLHLLGIHQVAVVINKMDLVDYDEASFDKVAHEAATYLAGLGVETRFVIPVSAREGDNLLAPSAATPWYEGPSVVTALDSFHRVSLPAGQPLRMPIQDIYHFDERRILAGRIESGVLRVGDSLLFSPSNKTARVRSIETWNRKPPVEAHAGESIGITLDEPLFLERGEVASHLDTAPQLTNVFRATLFWLGHNPLEAENRYKVKLATREFNATVSAIERIIDTDTLASSTADSLQRNQVGEVVLRTRQVVALDEYKALTRTGRIVINEGYDTVGGGIISMEGYPDQRDSMTVKSSNVFSVEHKIAAANREQRNGHRGGVLWFTGLSGAGKSTLAMEVERQLFQRGYQVYVLDGDNVRRGLNANLGFSPDDRAENIRRVGEAAALFADAGFICITAFISPYQADRNRARIAAERVGADVFHEIYVSADLETCESRDPKGLYKKAHAGEIKEFTGVSAPYEAPRNAELTVDTQHQEVAACVEAILRYVSARFDIKLHETV